MNLNIIMNSIARVILPCHVLGVEQHLPESVNRQGLKPMRRHSLHRLILVAMLLVMADLSPCLAQGVMIVQSSSVDAYQKAVSGFEQAFARSTSLPGISSIQPTQTIVLDPAGKDAVSVVAKSYQTLLPEVVVAVGNGALEAVKDLNGPIVYLLVANPEAIAQQRTNITGIKMTPGPLPQLARLQAALPSARKIAVLFDPATSADFVSLAQAAAGALDLTLVKAPAKDDREAILLIGGLAGQIDAIWLLPEPALISPALLNALALLSLEKHIPLIAFAPKYLELGAALAIFSSPEQLGMQAADLVKRLMSAPAGEAVRPEYGREAAVLANERIIQKLGLIFKRTSPPEGREAP